MATPEEERAKQIFDAIAGTSVPPATILKYAQAAYNHAPILDVNGDPIEPTNEQLARCVIQRLRIYLRRALLATRVTPVVADAKLKESMAVSSECTAELGSD